MEDMKRRVGEFEEDMKEVKSDVKAIMTNHLPHIQVDLERVKTEVRIFGAIILLAIGGLITLVVRL